MTQTTPPPDAAKDSPSIGDKIIAEIIKQSMFRVDGQELGQSHVIIWQRNAASQLDALVAAATKPDAADADRARLDWLEANKGRCGYSEQTYIGEAFFAHEHCMADKYFAEPTLRQAIDAAMARDAGRGES